MTAFWNGMQSGYQQYTWGGQYLGLFFVILLFLWLTGKNKMAQKEKYLLHYGAGMTALILFPPTAWILTKYQTPFYAYSHLFLLLPMTVVLAWGLTEVWEHAMAYTEKQAESRKFVVKHKKLCECAAALACALLLMLSGTVAFAARPTAKTEGSMKIPRETQEVLHILEEAGPEDELLLAPDEILEYARSYSGKFRLLYGRNMWNGALNAYTYDTYSDTLQEIHGWLNSLQDVTGTSATGGNMNAEEALQAIRESGCTILVLSRQKYEEPVFSRALKDADCFKLMEETAEYVILQKK